MSFDKILYKSAWETMRERRAFWAAKVEGAKDADECRAYNVLLTEYDRLIEQTITAAGGDDD